MESIAGRRLALGILLVTLGAIFSPLYAQSENVTLLSQHRVPGANDVWGYSAPDGTELAIVGTTSGTVFVDVTDPDDPAEVAFIPGDVSGWRDMKTYDHYAYSVNESAGGIQVFDLVDPQSPVLVGHVEAFTSSHNVFIDVEAGVLYVVGTSAGTILFDVATDPAQPRRITAWNDRYVHDIFARDGLAFAACIRAQTLVVLDVSDLPSITMLSETGYNGAFTHNTWLTDDGKYCVTTDELSAGHLHVFNVEDPTAPFEVSQWSNPDEPSSIVHNATIRDSFAFVSWYTAGLQIIDLSNPLAPVRAGYYDTFPGTGGFDGAWGVYPYARSGNIYVSDRNRGLFVFQFDGERGTVSGTVLDQNSRRPLPNVTVSFPDDHAEVRTAADGTYSIRLAEGSHRLEVDLFGYEAYEWDFEVQAREELDIGVELVKKPVGDITGTLTDIDGAPGVNVFVELAGSPLRTLSDDQGRFGFAAVPVGTYQIKTARFGYSAAPKNISVAPDETITSNVLLFTARVAENFETESGWTVGSPDDTATGGIWERGNPNGTWLVINDDDSRSGPVQPEDDHSEDGDKAFVTGNGESGTEIGLDDVDGGRTSLISPRYDLSEMSRPLLAYHRWFRNDAGANADQDPFLVDVSSDDGRTWINVETHLTPSEEWARQEVDLSSFFTPTAEVRLRFVAADEAGPSVVEAAVDDVEIFDQLSRIRGTVRSEDGPIAGVLVETGIPASVVETGADGQFEFIIPSGSYTVAARSFGFVEESVVIDVFGREDIAIDMELEKAPVGAIEGHVATPSGRSSVSGALVEFVGTPLQSWTDENGDFSLHAVPVGEYDIRISREGFESIESRAEITAKQMTRLEFQLVSLFATGLSSTSPNPFRDEIRFAFTLAEDATVELRIYDIQGREVQRLADETYSVGDHEIAWDGRDESGAFLPQGVYFQRFRVADVEARSRILILR